MTHKRATGIKERVSIVAPKNNNKKMTIITSYDVVASEESIVHYRIKRYTPKVSIGLQDINN